MRVPAARLGADGADLLIDQIERGPSLARRLVYVPELVVRGSTQAGARP